VTYFEIKLTKYLPNDASTEYKEQNNIGCARDERSGWAGQIHMHSFSLFIVVKIHYAYQKRDINFSNIIQQNFINSPHYHVRNSSGAHPASYPMGTRGSFPGGKAAGT